MSGDTTEKTAGKRKAEVMLRISQILDSHFTEDDLEMLAAHNSGHYDYLTDGFEHHCKTRIAPHIPGRQAQARA
jgi:hypothetical protein